jgi:hypothetical protein
VTRHHGRATAKVPPKVAEQRVAPRCVRCDGTGFVCKCCGESEPACACPETDKNPGTCTDCGGSGT